MDEFEARTHMDAALDEYKEIFPTVGVTPREVYGVTFSGSPSFTAYLSEGEVRWLRGNGYTVTPYSGEQGVVIQFPQRRASRNVEVEAPYGRHHLATVHDLDARRPQPPQ